MKENHKNYINAILDYCNVSQAALAEDLGVTQAALNRWVKGHAVPRPKMMEKIIRLYKERVGYPSITRKEILRQIQEVNKLKIPHLWDIISKNQRVQEELLLEQTYNSTSIEGTTFSKKETEAVIFDDALIKSKSLREHLEVTNHAVLLRQIFDKKYKEPISERMIKVFHRTLLQGIREDAGEYVVYQRGIRGVNLQLPHPEDIPEEVGLLIKRWHRKSKKTKLEKISEFHAYFEAIHPFGDGNGRVGRALMVCQCLQENYPPIIVENNRKAEYYEVLEYAQRNTLHPFVLFLCDEMKQTQLIIQKCLSKRGK